MPDWKETHKRAAEYLRAHRGIWAAVQGLAVLVVSSLEWLQMDIGCSYLSYILSHETRYYLLDLAIMVIFNTLLFLLLAYWYRALLTGSIIMFALSVANHYVWLFHGAPFSVGDLFSIGTAVQVMGGYRYPFDSRVKAELLLFLINGGLCLLLRAFTPRRQKRSARAALAAAVMCVALTAGVAAEIPKMPFWSWDFSEYVNQYSYFPALLRSTAHYFGPSPQPQGYSEEELLSMVERPTAEPARVTSRPDLIVILNESFFDLDRYVELNADAEYLDDWYARKNVLRGYSLSPLLGGGTNASEYELLTSDSIYLAKDNAPFTVMDMSDANSAVRYLKAMGYETWAMHPASPSSYNRNNAYPALGFDHIAFNDDFEDLQNYGDRTRTDASVYRNLLDWYRQGGDAPRFMYLLTYQNHGGYESNGEEWDTVHIGADLGDQTDDVEEYLTSIALSDDALADLLDSFEEMDRPILVCMVGDHAPAFIGSLPARGMSAQEKDAVARGVPFMIWANSAFGELPDTDAVQLSMPDLLPTMLQMAGLPLSPYYQTLLEVSQALPVRFSDSSYLAADGTRGSFAEQADGCPLLKRYYYMEYNDLCAPAQRHQWMFAPPVQP